MAEVIGVDVGGLKNLSRLLKDADPKLGKQLKQQMRGIGQKVAGDVRVASSWSRRIPGTVKVTVTGNGSRVTIKAGGLNAPHAPLFELGSSGNPDTIRHPTLAGARKPREQRTADDWRSMPTRPFMKPTLRRDLDEIVEMAAEALEGLI